MKSFPTDILAKGIYIQQYSSKIYQAQAEIIQSTTAILTYTSQKIIKQIKQSKNKRIFRFP